MDKEAQKKKRLTALHTERRSFTRLKGPDREFVVLDRWDPKLDGELDESKVVEELWQGKKVKGVGRNVDRVGVLKAARYEDTKVAE